jgi:hypothetical protein
MRPGFDAAAEAIIPDDDGTLRPPRRGCLCRAGHGGQYAAPRARRGRAWCDPRPRTPWSGLFRLVSHIKRTFHRNLPCLRYGTACRAHSQFHFSGQMPHYSGPRAYFPVQSGSTNPLRSNDVHSGSGRNAAATSLHSDGGPGGKAPGHDAPLHSAAEINPSRHRAWHHSVKSTCTAS